MVNVLETYAIELGNAKIDINIISKEKGFTDSYFLNLPEFGKGTKALLDSIKKQLLASVELNIDKATDPKKVEELKQIVRLRALAMLEKESKTSKQEDLNFLTEVLVNEMFGLGNIEFLLADGNLEELVINNATEAIHVYHKKYGWLSTNVFVKPEDDILNYANIIARKIGKQITVLDPLLDAHLLSGDRVNSTLFPISTKGNTITIRKFRRDPWTVTDLISNKTVSSEVMATIWEAIQYEMSVVFSGGTASGKTTILGVSMPFIPPNHRIISIEDTREIFLPEYLHWVPLTTREPNPEGKGEVTMLDLLVNSLRMRPDRIVVGEIRRKEEAEVLFEAMHTGHSAYTTVHANTADETIRRLTNPPIEIPSTMLDAVGLNIVMFRNRRLGVRRILQLSEYITERRGNEEAVKANILYRWKAKEDSIEKYSESIRFYEELGLYTGLLPAEINDEILEKKMILEWMLNQSIHNITDVGKVIAEYYSNSTVVLDAIRRNDKKMLLGEMKEAK
ncbi:MAG: ATPase, T2SS/T4P/T4SS family [archaeon]